MGRTPKKNDYQLAAETEELAGTWCSFDDSGYMSIGWGLVNAPLPRPLITLGDETLRSLTAILVARYPLEALGGL